MKNKNLKRIVALFLAVILAGLTGFTNITAAAGTELPFKDVKKTNWYYDYVKFVYEEGVMTGLNETTFGPNEAITRAMVVTVLYRLAGEPEVAVNKKPFPDVAKNKWYSAAVAWAKEAGIVGGYNDGNFGPNDNIKRQDFVKILKSYCDYICADFAPLTDESYKTKPDAKKVSKYAREYMDWAYKRNLIGQGSDLNPLGDLTRAEAAAMFMRFEMNKGYTYKVIPLSTPFNVLFFIETDNPDPKSFYFEDGDSVYAEEYMMGSVVPLFDVPDDIMDIFGGMFAGKSGYLAAGWLTDGGDLSLKRKIVFDTEPIEVPGIGQIAGWDFYTVEDTDVVVTVPALISIKDYLAEKTGEFIDLEAIMNVLNEILNNEEIRKFIAENLTEEKIIELINSFIDEDEIKKILEENLDKEKITEFINAFIDEDEIVNFISTYCDSENIAELIFGAVDKEDIEDLIDKYLNEEKIIEFINADIDEEKLKDFVDEYLNDESMSKLIENILNDEETQKLIDELVNGNEDLKAELEEYLDQEKITELVNNLINEDEIKNFIDEYLNDESVAKIVGAYLDEEKLQEITEGLKKFVDGIFDEETLTAVIDSMIDDETMINIVEEYLSDEAVAKFIDKYLDTETIINLIFESLQDETISNFFSGLLQQQ